MSSNDIEFLGDDEEISLLETLDHVLNKGLVIAGDITISVADVDLIFLGLNALLGSVETINRVLERREPPEGGTRSGWASYEDERTRKAG